LYSFLLKNLYICTIFKIKVMSDYRLMKKRKAEKILDKIKNNSPKIIFKTKTMTVTLKTKVQLKKWLDMYPTAEYNFIS
tara:strand:- start:1248 stop:1484 length:237 start_codon:yes stop_codon:yes gene_type:complete